MAKNNSGRGGGMTGVAAVALIGLGIFVGTKLKSPGPGGEGNEQGQPTESSMQTSIETPAPLPELPEQPPEPSLQPATAPAMIAVLIRGDGYLVARPDVNGHVPMALPEVADLAATTTGTEDGIRVRIQRHVTAVAEDQQRLYQTLAQVGITPQAMQQMDGFVE